MFGRHDKATVKLNRSGGTEAAWQFGDTGSWTTTPTYGADGFNLGISGPQGVRSTFSFQKAQLAVAFPQLAAGPVTVKSGLEIEVVPAPLFLTRVRVTDDLLRFYEYAAVAGLALVSSAALVAAAGPVVAAAGATITAAGTATGLGAAAGVVLVNLLPDESSSSGGGGA